MEGRPWADHRNEMLNPIQYASKFSERGITDIAVPSNGTFWCFKNIFSVPGAQSVIHIGLFSNLHSSYLCRSQPHALFVKHKQTTAFFENNDRGTERGTISRK